MKNYSMKKINNLVSKIKYLLKKKIWLSFSVKLNANTKLEGYNKIFKGANIENSKVGFGSYIGINTFLPKSDIGRFSTIGPEVKLVSGKHPAHDFVSIHPAFYSTRKQAGFTFVSENKFEELSKEKYSIKIGNDVWIGAHVLIMEGVVIGDGAIIGSGAIVSKNIEPYSINVGNPIKEIGKRFEEEEIKKLLELKWWNKDLKWIMENADKFDNLTNIFK